MIQEKLEKSKLNYREVSLTNDRLFLDVFGKKENIWMIEYFLECFWGFQKGSLKGKLSLAFESTLERSHVKVKSKRCDIIIMYQRILINIEMFSKLTMSGFGKSCSYLTTMYSTEVAK